jgi:hypothetical protein
VASGDRFPTNRVVTVLPLCERARLLELALRRSLTRGARTRIDRQSLVAAATR